MNRPGFNVSMEKIKIAFGFSELDLDEYRHWVGPRQVQTGPAPVDRGKKCPQNVLTCGLLLGSQLSRETELLGKLIICKFILKVHWDGQIERWQWAAKVAGLVRACSVVTENMNIWMTEGIKEPL